MKINDNKDYGLLVGDGPSFYYDIVTNIETNI